MNYFSYTVSSVVTEINGWVSIEDAAKIAGLTVRAIYYRILNDPRRTPSKKMFGTTFVRADKVRNFKKQSGRPRNGQHKPRREGRGVTNL